MIHPSSLVDDLVDGASLGPSLGAAPFCQVLQGCVVSRRWGFHGLQWRTGAADGSADCGNVEANTEALRFGC